MISTSPCASSSASPSCIMVACSSMARRRRFRTTRRCRRSIWAAKPEAGMARNLPGNGATGPVLEVARLNVYYGRAHALQQVSFALGQGVLAVVGRNGMGKTTLCNAVTGLIPGSGSVKFAGREILGLAPNEITALGIAYVPQGRRVWPSLSVDEHLRLVQRGGKGPWTIARVYQMFPRLAERRHNGGAQLSGGEQQMLAIARALLLNPKLLVMDEPTEGLAPVIVEQVTETLKSLAGEREISVLLVEQNLGVAIDVADSVAVMVNGRIARMMSAAELAADHKLQQQLLGVHAGGDGGDTEEAAGEPTDESQSGEMRIYTVRRAADDPTARSERLPGAPRSVRGVTAWNAGDPAAAVVDRTVGPRDALLETRADDRRPIPSFAGA